MTSRPPLGLNRRRFIVGGAIGASAPLLLRGPMASAVAGSGGSGADARAFGFPPADMTSKVVRPIVFPVEGNVTWSDTYGACRSGCSRAHEGQDLMGKKLQKLVACVDGKVVSLRHESGGNSLYIEDADGWYYAYLHINNDTPDTDDGKNPIKWAFAEGLEEGDTVTQGQHVAYLGDSGNAESSGAHCHFEIRRPSARGVWSAQAVNPKPSLDAAQPLSVAAFASTGPYLPFAKAEDLIAQQFSDFLGRPPSAAAMELHLFGLESGSRTAAWLIQQLLESTENQDSAGAVVRLYRAYFGRDADFSGFDFWLKKVRSGTSTAAVSEAMTKSSEFVRTYGSLSNSDFVNTVYTNVLGRTSDADGQAFWVDQLDRKLISRGRLMLRFSESTENRAKLAAKVNVILSYAQMLGKIPPATLVAARAKELEDGTTSLGKLVDAHRLSSAYKTRIS